MFAALDSSSIPTRTQMQAAYDSGVRMWWGYLGYPNDGLYVEWPVAAFQDAIAVFGVAGAYCSGWDDPAVLRAWADQIGPMALCVDVENGIRTDGPWIDSWCATANAGLYGNGWVHYHQAKFHILAAYPGYDPQATWSTDYAPNPTNSPCGWQWQGSNDEYGIGVDNSWMDDSIRPTPVIPPPEDDMALPYVSAFVPLRADIPQFAAGILLVDPFNGALGAEQLPAGGTPGCEGYVYSSVPTQSSDLGGGQPGPDYVYWKALGQPFWIPDAILNTLGVPGAPSPTIPGGTVLTSWFARADDIPVPIQGPKGDAGADGAPGPAGKDGPPGPTGLTGPEGPQGQTGPQGTPGTVGSFHHDHTLGPFTTSPELPTGK